MSVNADVRGTVVVNETLFAVTDVRLHDGLMHIHATIQGEAEAFGGGLTDCRIFGNDGLPIFELALDCPAYPASRPPMDNVHIILPIRLAEVVQK